MRCLQAFLLVLACFFGFSAAEQRGMARLSTTLNDGSELSLPFYLYVWSDESNYHIDLNIQLVMRQYAKLTQKADRIDEYVKEQMKLTDLKTYTLGVRNNQPFEAVNGVEGTEGRNILDRFYTNIDMRTYLPAFSLLQRAMLPAGLLGNLMRTGIEKADYKGYWDYNYETLEYTYRLAITNDRPKRYTPTRIARTLTHPPTLPATHTSKYLHTPARQVQISVKNQDESAAHPSKIMRIDIFHTALNNKETPAGMKEKRIISIDFGRQI
eukprot:GDKI01016949.1.p1 GENE.GDKI01016949.1~~GDKI01016949.1.p1  ORF type:complete len:268 (+),score=69.68 GDKI01016949.1:105-908(+)